MTLLWKNRENEHVFLDIDTSGIHTIHENFKYGAEKYH